MTSHDSYIYGLLIEKFNHTISEEDDRFVSEKIATESHWAAVWDDMQVDLSSPAAKKLIDDADEVTAWEKVAGRLGTTPIERPVRALWRNLSAAAVLLAVATVTLLLWRNYQKTTSNINAATKPVHKIELQLMSGQKIDLTGSKQVQVAGNSFKSSGRQLTYNAVPGGKDTWSLLDVPATMNYQVKLSDGTEVTLNSQSSLRFPLTFNATQREVFLTGEAFFKVAKNPRQPFIVHTDQNTVRVTGTQFNVNTYQSGQTITSLVEGSVIATGKGGQELKLSPGFESVFREGRLARQSAFDPDITTAWIKGIHYFFNVPLADIAQVIPRWFEVNVVFDNPQIATSNFTGAIEKNKPLQAFMDNLNTTAGIHATLINGVLHLK